jgi:hypothetical protein
VNNEVHLLEDGFYVFTEDGDTIGPFPSEYSAEIVAESSLKWAQEDNKPKLKKMKENQGL